MGASLAGQKIAGSFFGKPFHNASQVEQALKGVIDPVIVKGYGKVRKARNKVMHGTSRGGASMTSYDAQLAGSEMSTGESENVSVQVGEVSQCALVEAPLHCKECRTADECPPADVPLHPFVPDKHGAGEVQIPVQVAGQVGQVDGVKVYSSKEQTEWFALNSGFIPVGAMEFDDFMSVGVSLRKVSHSSSSDALSSSTFAPDAMERAIDSFATEHFA